MPGSEAETTNIRNACKINKKTVKYKMFSHISHNKSSNVKKILTRVAIIVKNNVD